MKSSHIFNSFSSLSTTALLAVAVFALTDAHGRYTITNVPPGEYTLVAWQERLPKDSRIITVPETGDRSGINFTLGPRNLPKY